MEHLAKTIDCFYEGFGFGAPWWMRRLVAPLLRRRFLNSPMPTGFQLRGRQAEVLAPPDNIRLDDALDHLRRATRRLLQLPPTQPHPVFGTMTQAEVQQLACRHAELHLSFIEPTV
jgi:hypothetical protein